MINGLLGKKVGMILLMGSICQAAVDATIAWEPSLVDVDGKELSSAVVKSSLHRACGWGSLTEETRDMSGFGRIR